MAAGVLVVLFGAGVARHIILGCSLHRGRTLGKDPLPLPPLLLLPPVAAAAPPRFGNAESPGTASVLAMDPLSATREPNSSGVPQQNVDDGDLVQPSKRQPAILFFSRRPTNKRSF